ncbi:hypothetical protein [Streptomyces californicus]|uniref:hypothetical protein n=1 Tax=Streptomyces californicus TaxID=67351 RepID=UPI00296F7FF7|nr:hypothetical protein [Streptomyces californicus]MDW4912622.1 hypothetical protein [Streptomyces californicus]
MTTDPSAGPAAGDDLLDETALLTHGDTIARALRRWCADRIEELKEESDLFGAPDNPSERQRWTLRLSERQALALAEVEQLQRVRAETNAAWSEDRWADLGALGLRHQRHLDEEAVAAACRLHDLSDAYPGRGRAPRPRQSTATPGPGEVAVPWGIDPGAPVTGRSPQMTSRSVWALLREAFPDASSGRCTVTAHRLLREALQPTVGPVGAMQMRREITAALYDGVRPPADEHEKLSHQWIVESVLGRVVVPLADQCSRLAAATDDVRALHPLVSGGRCPECGVASPCPTRRALGDTAVDGM